MTQEEKDLVLTSAGTLTQSVNGSEVLPHYYYNNVYVTGDGPTVLSTLPTLHLFIIVTTKQKHFFLPLLHYVFLTLSLSSSLLFFMPPSFNLPFPLCACP